VQGIRTAVSTSRTCTTVPCEVERRRRPEGTVETINGKDTLTRVGVTCALCHSTVDARSHPALKAPGWMAQP
jgi:hypothetical protein